MPALPFFEKIELFLSSPNAALSNDAWHPVCSGTGKETDPFRLDFSPRNSFVPEESWCCTVRFHDFQASHLLGYGHSMGGCVSFSKDGDEHDFSSANLLALRVGEEFLILEFSMGTPGEACWRGHWNNGKITEFRAEINERFATGNALPSFRLEIRCGKAILPMLKAWAIRHRGKRRHCTAAALHGIGWNTWDYYRWTITQEDVLANADFIAHDPVLSRHISRIVIDDGWMDCYGDWEPNSRFRNMEGLLRELRKMGFVPGLWFAPALAEPQSMLAQKNWEYLARGESGWPCLAFSCMKRNGFLLDPTRPEIQQHLYSLFKRYRDMGVGYFKLDFLQATLKAHHFSDPTATAPEIIRRLLRPISEAVGPECAILGCNHFFAAGSEYVDMARIASDIHARFDSIAANSTSIAARTMLQGILWSNDPDFSLVRGPETSDDPEMSLLRPCQVDIGVRKTDDDTISGKWACAGTMSYGEAKILLGLVVISAGEMNFSDNLCKLNEKGINLLRRAASAERGEDGYAEDLMEHEKASRYIQRLPSGGQRRLWINWGCLPILIDVPPAIQPQTVIRDFWSDQLILPGKHQLSPHDSLLLEYR